MSIFFIDSHLKTKSLLKPGRKVELHEPLVLSTFAQERDNPNGDSKFMQFVRRLNMPTAVCLVSIVLAAFSTTQSFFELGLIKRGFTETVDSIGKCVPFIIIMNAGANLGITLENFSFEKIFNAQQYFFLYDNGGKKS